MLTRSVDQRDFLGEIDQLFTNRRGIIGVGSELKITLEIVLGLTVTMNYPAASCGVSETGDEICLKGVTPECFYRGSRSGL